MTQVTIEEIPAPFTMPAKRGTPAVRTGQPVYTIVWHDSPFGELRFCWLYIDRAFAQTVADRSDITKGSIEANWRNPTSNKFYYTGRTEA